MPTQEELAAAQAVLDAAKGDQQEKITFDEKQQAKVEELIKGAKSAAAKELRAERDALKTEMDGLKSDLAKAVDAASKAKTPGERKEAQGDVDALRAEIAEMKRVSEASSAEFKRLQQQLQSKDKEVETIRNEAQNDRKKAAITAAATEANFISPSMVTTLTSDRVQWNPTLSRWVVLNDEGVERKNSEFEPMTLAEFYAEYADKNKFLVRGDVLPGAGSRSSSGAPGVNKVKLEDVFGPKSNGKLAHELGTQRPEEYQRLKAQAKAQGLI